jgi:ABC-type uncharacterized transport system permease subunit
MQAVLTFLSFLLPVLYALAAAAATVQFLSRGSRLKRAWKPLLFLTVGVHVVAIALRAAVTRRCPLGTVFEALELAAFSLAAVYLILELRRATRPTGILILPIAFLLELTAVVFRAEVGDVNPALKSPWFSLHAGAAVLGVAALAVSFVHGVFHLLLYREIKAHRVGLLFRRLPPLAELANMTHTAALIGWILLTVTIGAGYVWGIRADRLAAMHGDPVFYVTIAAWLLYTAGAFVRFVLGWRGRATVYLSVCAFSLLIVVLTVVSALWPSPHAYR